MGNSHQRSGHYGDDGHSPPLDNFYLIFKIEQSSRLSSFSHE
jgi:hypothetical protein